MHFLVNPSLYIIDEPFVGLDPIGIKSLLEQMTAEKGEMGLLFSCRHMFCQLRKNIATGLFCCTKDGCEQKERWMNLRKAFGRPGASLDDLYIAMTEEYDDEQFA